MKYNTIWLHTLRSLKFQKTYTSEHFKYMIEPLLFGIVLGIIPVSIIGLFVAAYLQYRRGNQLGL